VLPGLHPAGEKPVILLATGTNGLYRVFHRVVEAALESPVTALGTTVVPGDSSERLAGRCRNGAGARSPSGASVPASICLPVRRTVHKRRKLVAQTRRNIRKSRGLCPRKQAPEKVMSLNSELYQGRRAK
jgi:hypothetical protein